MKRKTYLFIILLSGIFLHLISIYGEDFNSLKGLGKFYLEKQWYDDAETNLLKAVSSYPAEAKKDDEVHFFLALLYYNKTNIEKAMEELTLALTINQQEKYVELRKTVLLEAGLVTINTAEKISPVSITIQTKERFISPRKKVIYNRWENRFQNEKFDLPLSGVYLPVGQYQMKFTLPNREKPLIKEFSVEPEDKESKVYLLLIDPPQKIAAEGKDNQIKLTWEKAGQGTVTGFEIYRKADGEKEEDYKKVGDTKETSYLDNGLGLSKKYYYKLRSYDSRMEKTDFSQEVSATTLSLEPPTEIVALGEDEQVKLFWVASHGAQVAGYRIYRSSSTEKEFKMAAELDTKTDYIDYDLARGETYIYKIKAFNATGVESAFSEKITTKTMGISAPSKIKISADSSGIELIWKKVPQAEGYYIYRGNKKLGQYELLAQVSGRETQYVDAVSKHEDAVNLWYKITTIDKEGKETRASNPISLAQPQAEGTEEDETPKGSSKKEKAEAEEESISSAPQENAKYKIYASNGPNDVFVETKITDIYKLASSLKAHQKVYYKIVSFDERNNPDASLNFTLQMDKINQPPVAVAGSDRQVVVRQSFVLDSSGSTDPEGDKLVYKWVQRLDNPNSPRSLLLSLEPKVELNLNVPGEYVFYLEVSDGELNNIQTVIVEVVGD